MATEKKLPSVLIDETTVQKVSLLTPHIGSVYSGMGPDSRVLVSKARHPLTKTKPFGARGACAPTSQLSARCLLHP